MAPQWSKKLETDARPQQLPELYSRNNPLHRGPRVGHGISEHFLGGRNMPRAIKGPGPWGTGWSAGPPNAGQFSRAFCLYQDRLGQNGHENWPENSRQTRFRWRTSAGPAHGTGPASERSRLNSARKPSRRQALTRPTPSPQPSGIPFMAVSEGARPATRPSTNTRLLTHPSVSRVLTLGASTWGTISPAP